MPKFPKESILYVMLLLCILKFLPYHIAMCIYFSGQGEEDDSGVPTVDNLIDTPAVADMPAADKLLSES